MELTSLSRAYLACEKGSPELKLLEHFKMTRENQWPYLKAEIETAEHHGKELGYCIAAWQPEVVALAAPI